MFNQRYCKLLGAVILLAAFQVSSAQQAAKKDEKTPAPTIDAATGKVLNEAIELLNKEDFKAASAKIETLKLDKLSPYERSKVEQIMFNISYSQEKYDEARGHLQKAIDAGGLNAAGSRAGPLPGGAAVHAAGEVEGRRGRTRRVVQDGLEAELRRLLLVGRGLLPAGRCRERQDGHGPVREGLGAREEGRRAHGEAAGELARDVVRVVSTARGLQGVDPRSPAADRARAGQEDVLDAVVVDLRADGGLRERARHHSGRLQRRARDGRLRAAAPRRPVAVQFRAVSRRASARGRLSRRRP